MEIKEKAIRDRIETLRWLLKPEGNASESIRTSLELMVDFIEYSMNRFEETK